MLFNIYYIFLLFIYSNSWPTPQSVPMEVYNQDTFRMKKEGLYPGTLLIAIHTHGGGSEASMYMDLYQQAAELVLGFPFIPADFGIFVEQIEECFLSVSASNQKDQIIPLDNETLVHETVVSLLNASYYLLKNAKKQFRLEENPEIVSLTEELAMVDKLIKTAVDKFDRRVNQERKAKIEERLSELIPKEKIQRNNLRNEIRNAKNESIRRELTEKLQELKKNRGHKNYSRIDYVVRALKLATLNATEELKTMDRRRERRRLIRHRRRVAKLREYDTEEEDQLQQLFAAASEAADNDKDRKEYSSKVRSLKKLKEFKMREANKKKARRIKRRMSLDPNDPINLPPETLGVKRNVFDETDDSSQFDDTQEEHEEEDPFAHYEIGYEQEYLDYFKYIDQQDFEDDRYEFQSGFKETELDDDNSNSNENIYDKNGEEEREFGQEEVYEMNDDFDKVIDDFDGIKVQENPNAKKSDEIEDYFDDTELGKDEFDAEDVTEFKKPTKTLHDEDLDTSTNSEDL